MIARLLGLDGLGTDFRRLLGATLGSNLADGIVGVSMALAAVSLTTDPVLVAAVAVAASVPPILIVLLVGVIADRTDRRRLMVAVQVLRVATLAVLTVAVLAGSLSIPVLVLAAFALSVGQTFNDTTSQAILPMVAGGPVLTRANSRLGAAETLSDSFVGPPLGGALATIGLGLAFAGAAVGYAVGGVGLLLLAGTFRVDRTGVETSVREEIGAGLTFLVHHRLQRTLTLIVAMGTFATAAVFAVFVLYAVAPGPMGLSGFGYGLLLTAMGLGSLLGALLAERVERRLGTARTLMSSAVGFAIAFAVPAVTADRWLVAIGLFLGGITIMLWNVVNVSLRQRFIPPGLYGRVHAGHRLVARLAGLAGGVAGGIVASTAGLQAVFIMAVVTILASGLGGLVVTDRAVAEALAAADPEA